MSDQPGETGHIYEETPRQAVREDLRADARRGNNTAAWVIAALVAVVAIIAVVFMVGTTGREDKVSPDDLTAVAEQARTQGLIEGAQSGYNAAAAQAQSSYNAAATNAQIAADRAAADARAAAAETRAAAERARADAAESLNRDAEQAPEPVEPLPQ
ncbi:MAG TPA: hypothetical protein VEA44_02175 [Caulobacter sp.]|nr:hypothetical protein [Caulobacter sp.]